MKIPVPQGVGPPNLLAVTYDPGVMGLNLLLVTAISLQVTRTDGTVATWACAITGASQGKLSFTHAFAAGDCTVTGLYTCAPTLTVGGQAVEANVFYLFVTPPRGLRSELP